MPSATPLTLQWLVVGQVVIGCVGEPADCVQVLVSLPQYYVYV